jgi:hypothetical protein
MATEPAASSHQSLDSDAILDRYGKLPMAFEKNHGQADDTATSSHAEPAIVCY